MIAELWLIFLWTSSAPQAALATPSEQGPSERVDQAPARNVILLVRSPGDDGVVGHLRAELLQSAWDVVEIRPDERRPRPPLSVFAEQQHAGAAVSVDTRAGQIELWIRREPKPIAEVIAARGEELSDLVLALRTTEALRAHGLRFDAAPVARVHGARAETPARARAADRAPAPKPVALTRTELLLTLGVGATLSPGGLPGQAHGLLELGLELRPWAVTAFGMIPVHDTSLEEPEGSVETRLWLAGVSIGRSFWATRALSLTFGPGFLLSIQSFDGVGAPGYSGRRQTLVTAAPLVRGGLSFGLARRLQLEFTGLLGMSVPEVEVELDSRPVATWGRPLVGMYLGASWAFVDL